MKNLIRIKAEFDECPVMELKTTKVDDIDDWIENLKRKIK